MGRRDGGLMARTAVGQWLEAEGQNFNQPSSALVFHLAFAPMLGLKQDTAAIEQNEAKLANVLDVYDRRLGESKFLAGDDFTLADLVHLPNGHILVSKNKADLFMSRKYLGRWFEEISARPSWKKVVEMQNTPQG